MLRGSLFKTALCLAACGLAACAALESPEPRTTPAPPVEPPAVDTGALEDAYAQALLQDDSELTPGEKVSPAPHDELEDVVPELTAEALERERERVAALPPSFDIPMVTNKKVLAWVDYYSNQHPQSFLPGLVRSGRYLEMFREVFAEAGLPRDLVYMAHVESAYKANAYSRARAKGIFQFIAGTARRYGLRVDDWVDERSDPEKSARAAAAYLKDLYAEFGDWYLALAAYNAGEGKIRYALRRSGKQDFWSIAKSSRYLRRETRNYVPAILAATLISKTPHEYGFEFEPEPPLRYDSIEVDGGADLRVLARCAGSDFETLRALNPSLRHYQTPPHATTVVHVPEGAGETTLAALGAIPENERVLYVRHRVRSGDTLSSLARRYRVGVSAIQQANKMGRSTLIREGRTLLIPSIASGDYADAGVVDAPRGEPLTYRVQRGDTLFGIARRHDTTVAAIAATNGIRADKILHVGDKLTIVPGARAAGVQTSSSSTTHTVRRGDTLWRIATLYRTTVAHLCQLNRISPETVLRPGDKLAVAAR